MAAVLLAEPEVASVEPLLERLRLSGIHLPHPAEVRDYLMRHPELQAVTRKVSDLATAAFAEQAELSLERYEDRESDDTTLTLYVRQTPYDERVWETIERLRESYEGEIAGSQGWLQVTVDFRAAAGR